MERQAAQAQQRLAAAREQQGRAEADPDLRLAGQVFDNEAAARDAQRRLDDATLALRRANGDVDAAEEALAHIRRQAHALRDEWDQASSTAAGELRDAAEFAPHKPGLLSRLGNDVSDAVSAVGDWVGEHLDEIHSVLSSVSAVAGLVALCTPPPVDGIALGVSLVAGAGALATSLADPAIRRDMGEVLHGHMKGNWGTVFQLGGDVVGLVPGFGLAKGVRAAAKEGDLLAETIRGYPKIVDVVSKVAHDPGWVAGKVEKYVPQVGVGLEKIGLLEHGAAEIRNAPADMVNFLNKTRGAVTKTVGAGVDVVTGGDD